MASPEYRLTAGDFDAKKATLVGGLAVLPIAAAALDVGLGAKRWPRTEAAVDFCDESAPEDTSHLWLGTPPLGWESSNKMGEIIGASLDAPLCYVDLPQRRPSLDKIGESIGNFFEKHETKSVSIAACSWGGILACNILPYLPEDVKLRRVVFDHCPTGIDDARMKGGLVRFLDKIGYPGGPLSSFIVASLLHKAEAEATDSAPASITDKFLFGFQQLSDRVNAGKRRIGPEGGSSSTYTYQLSELVRASPLVMQQNFQNRMTGDTEVAYIMPENPLHDEVVDVIRAIAIYCKIAGIPVTVLRIPNGTHASAMRQPDAYKTAFSNFISGKNLTEYINPDELPPLDKLLACKGLAEYANTGIDDIQRYLANAVMLDKYNTV